MRYASGEEVMVGDVVVVGRQEDGKLIEGEVVNGGTSESVWVRLPSGREYAYTSYGVSARFQFVRRGGAK